MRQLSLCTLGLMAALVGPLRAGWKITTQTNSESGQSVSTEYFSGGLKRTDQVDPHGRRYITVLDLDHMRQFLWNVDSREYIVVRLNRYAGFSPLPLSRQVTVIDRATTDTGERRTIFGRTARRLVTRETSHVEGGAPRPEERQIDAWYIDANTLPREKRGGAVAFLDVAGSARPNIRVNHSGPAATGLPVSETITSTYNGESRKWTIEVTELVEGPLDMQVFTPPPDFKRRCHFTGDSSLPWIERIQLLWEWFEDALGSSGV